MYNQIVTRDLKESTTLKFIAMATKHGWNNMCTCIFNEVQWQSLKAIKQSHLERKCKIGLKKLRWYFNQDFYQTEYDTYFLRLAKKIH